MASRKRILSELEDIKKNSSDYYTADTISGDIYKWRASIKGPNDSPYEGGTFYLYVEFPENYPFKPPKISFITKIYHCNVDNNGGICLDILKEQWSPALTISKLLLSISSLLDDPNPDDPLMLDIAKLYRDNKKEHNRRAAENTARYAVKIDGC